MALPNITSGLVKDIYGSNANDAVSHGLTQVNNSNKMSGAIFYNVAQKAIAERTRRGGSPVAIPSNYYTGKLFASKIQEINKQIQEAELMVELLERTEKTLSSCTYDVKNIIEIIKLETM
jgi:hypothetical protein